MSKLNSLEIFANAPKQKPSDRKVSKKGCVLSYETRSYVSSLSPDKISALEFQEIIQGHWEVENCLHMVKDRDWGEDKHVLRREGLGEVWTVQTNMAVSVLRLLRGGAVSGDKYVNL